MNKFNNGNSAVVCDLCGKIITTGKKSDNVIDICENCEKSSFLIDNFDRAGLIMKDGNPYMVTVGELHFFFYSHEELLRKKEYLIKLSRASQDSAIIMYVNTFKDVDLKMTSKNIYWSFISSCFNSMEGATYVHRISKDRENVISWIKKYPNAIIFPSLDYFDVVIEGVDAYMIEDSYITLYATK